MSRQLTATHNKYLVPHQRDDEGTALSVMDRLFNRLDGIYPHKWRAAFASEQAIKNWRDAWADAFAEDDLTLDEIKAGLSACRRTFAWPPSLPEFISLCRPGLEPSVAWNEAVKQIALRAEGRDKWSHPAIYWSAVAIGEFDLKNLTFITVKARWERILTANLKKELAPVPPRMMALPMPGKTVTTQEAGREKIKAICAAFAKNKSFNLSEPMHKSMELAEND